MASKKELKKDINYLSYELLNECYTYKNYHPEADNKKIDEIISNIIKKRNDLIHQANHPEENTSKSSLKEHYKKIIQDCNENFISILDKLNEL